MKKKKIFIISALVAVLLLILTGGIYLAVKNNNKSGQFDNRVGKMRQPDFGQPERQPDVRGVVKSIVGNEITVLKVEMPNRDRNSSSTPASGDKTRAAVSLVGGSGGPGMDGARGGMGRPGGEQDNNTRAQMLATLKEMSTGEEKIIIPVGIQMLKFSTSGGKSEPVEATLADITADKSITVWTSSAPTSTSATTTIVTDNKIAEFVLIN